MLIGSPHTRVCFRVSLVAAAADDQALLLFLRGVSKIACRGPKEPLPRAFQLSLTFWPADGGSSPSGERSASKYYGSAATIRQAFPDLCLIHDRLHANMPPLQGLAAASPWLVDKETLQAREVWCRSVARNCLGAVFGGPVTPYSGGTAYRRMI